MVGHGFHPLEKSFHVKYYVHAFLFYVYFTFNLVHH